MSATQSSRSATATHPLHVAFAEHYGRLFTLAFRVTGSRHDAEDALQTAFLNACTAFDHFRAESSLGTWLYRIVVNTACALKREAQRLPVVVYAEEHGLTEAEVFQHVATFGLAEDEALINRTRESCCQVFMNCMPSKARAVFTLRAILQFSIKDTAEILETSEGSVKVEFHRAQEIVKEHFEGRCSLIKPGSRCDCRAFAEYLRRTRRTQVLIDMDMIHHNEAAAKTKFLLEMRHILGVEELYAADPVPLDYASFKDRVKRLRADRDLSLLNP